MKRFFFLLTLAASTFFTSSYAAAPAASPVTDAFEATFAGAKEIAWEQVGVLHKATFFLNGHYRSAFYNSDGELIAETRSLSVTELPQALQASLKTSLQTAWITDVFVVTIEGDNTYYVHLENATGATTLKSSSNKKWTVYQKTDK